MHKLARLTQWLLATALVVPVVAQAQTLRWASQGDPQTMDPHSQNESMTNMMNGQVYEGLVARDKKLGIVPALATEWEQVSPLVWRFKLRPNVKFHDGSPFTADDVVFSIQRGQAATSQLNNYANAVGTPKKVDDLTVEFHLQSVNPIFMEHMSLPLWILSKAWCEKHKVTKPLDFKNKEETHASMNANGTGPVHAGQPRARHQDGLQAQPELVGQTRRQRAGDRLHADRQRCDTAGRARLGRDRLCPRPRAARRAAPAHHPRREDHRRTREPHRLHRHGPAARRAAARQPEEQEPVQGHPRAQGALPRGRHRDA